MRVAVIGAGIMGSGLAQLAAMNGDEVSCCDVSERQLASGLETIETSLARFVRSGKVDEKEARASVERIDFTTELEPTLEEVDAVIEAVPERIDLKHEVLNRAAAGAPAEALLATNTSQLSITAIGAGLGEHAPRLVGVHFFNPPVIMRLVEVVAGLLTTEEAIARARAFADHLGKEVVVCLKDSPGFITTRAYAALRTECMRMLDEGLATAADIDKALRLAFNFPMGPFELSDANGVDTYLQVLDGLHDAFGERFAPPVGLRNMIAANRLGRKTGAGFYEYEPEG